MTDQSFAIVIASKNRPADIERAVRSIRAQPTQPDELIVVDQSDSRYEIDGGPGLLHHYDPSIPGLTVARNVGIGLNRSSIVLFLDDDVEVVTDIVAQLRTLFRNRPDAIGAQTEIFVPADRTLIDPPRLGGRLWVTWQRIFWRGFFQNAVIPKPGTDELERVHGCAMAFRASLFEREQFDGSLVDYSYGEDWEFSKRARRHGRMYLVRGAKIIHHESPANRYRQRRLLEQRWRNVHYFYRKLAADRVPADTFWLAWWMLGETIVWLRKGYGFPRLGENTR